MDARSFATTTTTPHQEPSLQTQARRGAWTEGMPETKTKYRKLLRAVRAGLTLGLGGDANFFHPSYNHFRASVFGRGPDHDAVLSPEDDRRCACLAETALCLLDRFANGIQGPKSADVPGAVECGLVRVVDGKVVSNASTTEALRVGATVVLAHSWLATMAAPAGEDPPGMSFAKAAIFAERFFVDTTPWEMEQLMAVLDAWNDHIQSLIKQDLQMLGGIRVLRPLLDKIAQDPVMARLVEWKTEAYASSRGLGKVDLLSMTPEMAELPAPVKEDLLFRAFSFRPLVVVHAIMQCQDVQVRLHRFVELAERNSLPWAVAFEAFVSHTEIPRHGAKFSPELYSRSLPNLEPTWPFFRPFSQEDRERSLLPSEVADHLEDLSRYLCAVDKTPQQLDTTPNRWTMPNKAKQTHPMPRQLSEYDFVTNARNYRDAYDANQHGPRGAKGPEKAWLCVASRNGHAYPTWIVRFETRKLRMAGYVFWDPDRLPSAWLESVDLNKVWSQRVARLEAGRKATAKGPIRDHHQADNDGPAKTHCASQGDNRRRDAVFRADRASLGRNGPPRQGHVDGNSHLDSTSGPAEGAHDSRSTADEAACQPRPEKLPRDAGVGQDSSAKTPVSAAPISNRNGIVQTKQQTGSQNGTLLSLPNRAPTKACDEPISPTNDEAGAWRTKIADWKFASPSNLYRHKLPTRQNTNLTAAHRKLAVSKSVSSPGAGAASDGALLNGKTATQPRLARHPSQAQPEWTNTSRKDNQDVPLPSWTNSQVTAGNNSGVSYSLRPTPRPSKKVIEGADQDAVPRSSSSGSGHTTRSFLPDFPPPNEPTQRTSVRRRQSEGPMPLRTGNDDDKGETDEKKTPAPRNDQSAALRRMNVHESVRARAGSTSSEYECGSPASIASSACASSGHGRGCGVKRFQNENNAKTNAQDSLIVTFKGNGSAWQRQMDRIKAFDTTTKTKACGNKKAATSGPAAAAPDARKRKSFATSADSSSKPKAKRRIGESPNRTRE